MNDSQIITQEHMNQAEEIMSAPDFSAKDINARYGSMIHRGMRRSKAWKALDDNARALYLLLLQISRHGIS